MIQLDCVPPTTLTRPAQLSSSLGRNVAYMSQGREYVTVCCWGLKGPIGRKSVKWETR